MKKAWITIQVNLERAYDRIMWDFIVDALVEVGISQTIRQVILQCITMISI